MPVWVDFCDLPLQTFAWMKDTGFQLGKVKGYKPFPNINPKWEPQLEVDTSKTLKDEICIHDDNGNLLMFKKWYIETCRMIAFIA